MAISPTSLHSARETGDLELSPDSYFVDVLVERMCDTNGEGHPEHNHRDSRGSRCTAHNTHHPERYRARRSEPNRHSALVGARLADHGPHGCESNGNPCDRCNPPTGMIGVVGSDLGLECRPTLPLVAGVRSTTIFASTPGLVPRSGAVARVAGDGVKVGTAVHACSVRRGCDVSATGVGPRNPDGLTRRMTPLTVVRGIRNFGPLPLPNPSITAGVGRHEALRTSVASADVPDR